MAKKKRSRFTGKPAFARLQRHLLAPEAERGVEWEHQLGTLVDHLCPRGTRAYGQGHIQALAAELGRELASANKLWNARKLAAAIPRDDLVKLLRSANKRGFGMSATHILALASVKDVADRKKLGTQCVDGAWSVVQLRREIHKVQGKQSQGGVSVSQPRSVDQALAEVLERSKDWINRYEQAWFAPGPKGLLRPMSRAAVDRLADDLDDAIDLLRELRDAADFARRRLQDQRTRTADHRDQFDE